MIIINGKKFYDFPYICGHCPFFLSFGRGEGGRESQQGVCTLFDKSKGYASSRPKRCSEMFEKASTFPYGSELVLVAKD